MIHTTREAWLVAGIEMLSEIFTEQGLPSCPCGNEMIVAPTKEGK